MIAFVAGILLSLVGLPFLVRGWIFSMKPEHPISLSAKERNLRMGLETDMKKWGRRVRRFGFIMVLAGAGLITWGSSSIFG